jgi:hypothetical protein
MHTEAKAPPSHHNLVSLSPPPSHNHQECRGRRETLPNDHNLVTISPPHHHKPLRLRARRAARALLTFPDSGSRCDTHPPTLCSASLAETVCACTVFPSGKQSKASGHRPPDGNVVGGLPRSGDLDPETSVAHARVALVLRAGELPGWGSWSPSVAGPDWQHRGQGQDDTEDDDRAKPAHQSRDTTSTTAPKVRTTPRATTAPGRAGDPGTRPAAPRPKSRRHRRRRPRQAGPAIPGHDQQHRDQSHDDTEEDDHAKPGRRSRDTTSSTATKVTTTPKKTTTPSRAGDPGTRPAAPRPKSRRHRGRRVRRAGLPGLGRGGPGAARR